MISHLSEDRPERDDIGVEEFRFTYLDDCDGLYNNLECPICKHRWREHASNYWEGCRHLNDDGPCGCWGEF